MLCLQLFALFLLFEVANFFCLKLLTRNAQYCIYLATRRECFYRSKTTLICLALSAKDEKADFANSVDSDEVAQNEPPHIDLRSLPSSL